MMTISTSYLLPPTSYLSYVRSFINHYKAHYAEPIPPFTALSAVGCYIIGKEGILPGVRPGILHREGVEPSGSWHILVRQECVSPSFHFYGLEF